MYLVLQQKTEKEQPTFSIHNLRYLYYKVPLSTLTTNTPVFKLWDTQGYLWLPYDLTEVTKLIGETFESKRFFFRKFHSFRINVIPSGLLSSLPLEIKPLQA